MCTASHSSDDDGCPGTLQIGLREWCIGRPSGLADAPTPVSPQCSCAPDFPSEIQRPYYRCAHQPSLVAGSRADPVQARCDGVQSATWTCTKLPRATCPRRRCVWSSSTPLRRHESHPDAPVISTTVGSRSFPVVAPLIWNSVPDDVISAESLPTFQRKLKRHLFCQLFPGFCY